MDTLKELYQEIEHVQAVAGLTPGDTEISYTDNTVGPCGLSVYEGSILVEIANNLQLLELVNARNIIGTTCYGSPVDGTSAEVFAGGIFKVFHELINTGIVFRSDSDLRECKSLVWYFMSLPDKQPVYIVVNHTDVVVEHTVGVIRDYLLATPVSAIPWATNAGSGGLLTVLDPRLSVIYNEGGAKDVSIFFSMYQAEQHISSIK